MMPKIKKQKYIKLSGDEIQDSTDFQADFIYSIL